MGYISPHAPSQCGQLSIQLLVHNLASDISGMWGEAKSVKNIALNHSKRGVCVQDYVHVEHSRRASIYVLLQPSPVLTSRS